MWENSKVENIFKIGIKKIVVLVILSIVGLFVACNQAENQKSQQVILEEHIFMPEYYSPNENIDTVSVFNSTIYYGTSEGEFYFWDIENDSIPKKIEWFKMDKELYNWGIIQPDFQGNFYFIYNLNRYKKDEDIPDEELVDNFDLNDTYLVKYDIDGKQIFCERLVGALQNCYINSVAVDREGHLFILGNSQIFLYDIDCTYKNVIVSNEKDNGIFDIANNENGVVYGNCVGERGNSIIREISYNEGFAETGFEKMAGEEGFVPYKENKFLTIHSGKLYCYDGVTQTQKEVLKWMNSDVDINQIEKFGVLSDDRIVVFVEDENYGILGEIVILTKTKKNEVKQKEQITVGTFCTDTNLMRSVAHFNKYNKEYRIEVIEYYDPVLDDSTDGSQKKDAYTQLHLDIVSDKCPDILCLEYAELQKYTEDGLFIDLKSFINKSEISIMSNVIDAYTFDDKLLGLPVTVKVRTLVGRVPEVDIKTGWTVKDLMNCNEGKKEKPLLMANSQKMLQYCLKFNLSEYVDMNRGICKFTTNNFCDILEFCKSFSGVDSYPNTSIYSVGEGNALFYEVELTQPNDITLLNQLFRTDELAFVGFPSMSGKGRHVLEANGGSYSISALSKHKEGAWVFLESMLKNTVKISYYTRNAGFPIEEEVCEQYFQFAMENPYDENGNRNFEDVLLAEKYRLFYYVPTEEEVKILRELLETATITKDSNKDIMDIIFEESDSYFNEQRSINQVIEIIQNRITVYLNEHR